MTTWSRWRMTVPTTDERISAALHDAAREPAGEDVVGRVQAKWRRRRVVRRAEMGLVAAAVVAGLLVAGITLLDTGANHEVTIGPGPGTAPVVRVAPGAPSPDVGHSAKVATVTFAPDEGYVRGPLLGNGTSVALAAYNRAGSSFTYPPSHILRVTGAGKLVDRVDLQGEVLALSDGEGARWALTRDKTVVGPQDTEFRVKRIGPNGNVVSNPVPAGEQVLGEIKAGGGGVWVPVRHGVLRFDPATGAYAGAVYLPTDTGRRALAAYGKGVYVTDGRGLRRLDPGTDTAVPAPEFRLSASVTQVVDVASSNVNGPWFALTRDATGTRWSVAHPNGALRLPQGFAANSVFAEQGVVWVEGALHGKYVVLVLDPANNGLVVSRTLRIAKTADTDVVFTSPSRALVTSSGSMYTVRLPG